MKSGWAIKKLGEVCELIGGGTPSIHESSYYGGNIPWATVRDMNCRVIEKTERTITRKGLENSASNVIPAGNVIISTHVGLGKVCFVAQDTAINQDLKGVIPLADTIQRSFLYYWFLSIAEYLEKSGTGSTVRGVKLDFVKNLEFPVPSLPEQKRIVAKIDAAFEKIDKLKANAERNLANAKELFQSALDEAMRPKKGWVEKRLGEVCDSVLGKMLDRMKNRGRPEKYLRNVNVRWGSFDLSNLLEMGFEEDEQERFGLRRGDLVMCEGGEPGRCAVWTGVPAKMKFQKALHRIRCPKELNPYFLYYQFRAQAGAGVLQKYFDGRDATIKHLTGKLLKTVLLFFPSLAEQKEIIKRLDFLAEKTKLLEHHYTRQIADCAEMRQSVLREAFEGRL